MSRGNQTAGDLEIWLLFRALFPQLDVYDLRQVTTWQMVAPGKMKWLLDDPYGSFLLKNPMFWVRETGSHFMKADILTKPSRCARGSDETFQIHF